MELMIELPGRGGQQNELHKVSGERITVGRAYDNDIILHDPHVCPHHAVIEIVEGEITIQDLGSVNGTYTKSRQQIVAPSKLDSGDEFYLAKSRIRIYRTDHPVAPSIRLNWVEKLASLSGQPLWAGALGLLTLLLILYLQYGAEIGKFYMGRELLASVGVLLLIALWPASWSLFARYKKHDPHFLAQLSVSLVFMIMLTLLSKFEDWIAYHNGSSLLLEGIMLIIGATLVLLLIWYHLYLSIFLDKQKRWIYSAAMTLFIASIVYVGYTIDSEGFDSRPRYVATIFPPSLSFYDTQTLDEMMSASVKVFDNATEEAGHPEK